MSAPSKPKPPTSSRAPWRGVVALGMKFLEAGRADLAGLGRGLMRACSAMSMTLDAISTLRPVVEDPRIAVGRTERWLALSASPMDRGNRQQETEIRCLTFEAQPSKTLPARLGPMKNDLVTSISSLTAGRAVTVSTARYSAAPMSTSSSRRTSPAPPPRSA